jgi:lantibiotic modifying enzyme
VIEKDDCEFRIRLKFIRRLRAAIRNDKGCRICRVSELKRKTSGTVRSEALTLFCCFGLSELKRRTGSRRWRLIARSGKQNLLDHLAERLGLPIEGTLQLISNVKPTWATEQFAHSPKKREHQKGHAIARALMNFPSVVEIISLVLTDWIKAQHELLFRLERDSVRLKQFAGARIRSGCVERLIPGLSDQHGLGRSVTKIGFLTGQPLIYRPRATAGERLWSESIAWINAAEFDPRLKTVTALSRRTYGWEHFISSQSCKSLTEVRLFYVRWGAQSALARIFGFADLHFENWIASGSHPVLVDAEVFGQDASRLQRMGLKVSELHPLLATGLLPFCSHKGMDYRGAAPFDLLESFSSPPPCWPRYRRKYQAPVDFADEILRGFASMIEFIWKDSSRRRRLEGLLKRSGRMRRRVLIRSTGEYWSLLEKSLSPEFLLFLNTRYLVLLRSCRRDAPSRRVAAAEARALVRCSIPHFISSPNKQKASLPSENEMWLSFRLLRRSLATLCRAASRSVASPKWVSARVC